MAAISAVDSRNPSLDRRQTMSSAVQAHSADIRYLTSALRQGGAERLAEIGHRFRVAEQFAGARAVGMRQPVGMRRRQERIVAHQFGGQCRRSPRHPCRRRAAATLPVQPSRALEPAQIGREPLQRLLGEPAIGGDLAAIDRQQRRAAGRVELEDVIAGGGLGFAGAVVIERAHAGIGPDHVLRLDRLCQIFADGIAEIFDFLRRRLHLGRVAVVIAIGGADQREIVLIGNDEDDAAVAVLEHVGAVVRHRASAPRCGSPAPAAPWPAR